MVLCIDFLGQHLMFSDNNSLSALVSAYWRAAHANKLTTLFHYLYLAALVVIATWVYQASATLPWIWPVLWICCLAVLALGPIFPELGPLIYLVVAYATPRYGKAAEVANPLALAEMFAYLALASFLLNRLVHRTWPEIRGVFDYLLIALWCIVGVSALNAIWLHGQPWDPLGEDPMGQFNQVLILGLLGHQLLSSRTALLRLAGTLICILIFRIIINDVRQVDGDHDFPFLIVVSLPFLLTFTSAATWPVFAKVLQAFFALGFSAVVLMSRNRGAIFALPPMIFVLWMRSTRKQIVGVTMLAIVAGFAIFSPLRYYVQRFAGFGFDETSMSRLYAWQGAIRMMREHPLLGVGLGNFQALSRGYAPRELSEDIVAHNNFFHVGGEAGLLGLLVYGSLVIVTFFSARRLYRSSIEWLRTAGRMIELSMISYLAGGMFISRHNFVLAYIIMGVAAGSIHALTQIETDATNLKAAPSPSLW